MLAGDWLTTNVLGVDLFSETTAADRYRPAHKSDGVEEIRQKVPKRNRKRITQRQRQFRFKPKPLFAGAVKRSFVFRPDPGDTALLLDYSV